MFFVASSVMFLVFFCCFAWGNIISHLSSSIIISIYISHLFIHDFPSICLFVAQYCDDISSPKCPAYDSHANMSMVLYWTPQLCKLVYVHPSNSNYSYTISSRSLSILGDCSGKSQNLSSMLFSVYLYYLPIISPFYSQYRHCIPILFHYIAVTIGGIYLSVAILQENTRKEFVPKVSEIGHILLGFPQFIES